MRIFENSLKMCRVVFGAALIKWNKVILYNTLKMEISGRKDTRLWDMHMDMYVYDEIYVF